ncbi:MAG: triose-phosphate isomerase [Rhodobacteraceae bacterium]|jgi:triosephosphate isomerase|nr:triose-phosphate isomerase [Paracoccaceae bacterium]NCV29073.1 triose-phosphate isomerase [Paracoccaceae bacterium]NCV66728.1 triose-phosphate isomerase [Paracoccaceae bacterium]NCW02974.1 triose-phosphate isomerase [Paracoccaceae bacterium]NCW60148.1 triose-phosphate isomerase [Paracoccaceae bacterium]
MRKLAAGNWKMNGTRASLSEVKAINAELDDTDPAVVICPPVSLLIPACDIGGKIGIGAQDCHMVSSGAHTGDISANQIADTGATYVIIGHSERRTDHGETSDMIKAKAQAALKAGLIAIVCIGETLAEREAGETLNVLGQQMSGSIPDGATSQNTVIAYEPVWAIGTGLVPTLDQIDEAHRFMRAELLTALGADAQNISLLYGGSVKGSNADDIFSVADVDGALVGGASLSAHDFVPIIKALSRA